MEAVHGPVDVCTVWSFCVAILLASLSNKRAVFKADEIIVASKHSEDGKL